MRWDRVEGLTERHGWAAECPLRKHTVLSVTRALDGHGAGWGQAGLWPLWRGLGSGGISKGELDSPLGEDSGLLRGRT